MIFDAIAVFLIGILNGVLGLLPTYDVDFSLGGLGANLRGLNSVFPAATIGYCLFAIIGLEVFLLGVTFVTWIWDKIPFKFS